MAPVEVEAALGKDKGYIGRRYVEIFSAKRLVWDLPLASPAWLHLGTTTGMLLAYTVQAAALCFMLSAHCSACLFLAPLIRPRAAGAPQLHRQHSIPLQLGFTA